MAELDFKGMIVSFVLIGLFIFAILNFGIYLSSNNNANMSITDDSVIGSKMTDINTTLRELQDDATDKKQEFEEETGSLSTGFLIFGSILGTTKAFFSTVLNIASSTFSIIDSGLGLGGTGTLILGVFSGIIIVVTLLLIWRVAKAGS